MGMELSLNTLTWHLKALCKTDSNEFFLMAECSNEMDETGAHYTG